MSEDCTGWRISIQRIVEIGGVNDLELNQCTI